MDEKNVNKDFISLIISLSAAAWQQLGKVHNVLTGKVERNLTEAKVSIDILDMLKEKTRNNLTEEEEKLLLATLSDLQLNYVEELRKEEPQETKH